jgi:transcriptional regulator with XRE-family HTH domain
MAQQQDSGVPKVGAVLRAWRASTSHSQERLAELSGLDRTLYGKYERGISEPTVPQLEKVARAYGIVGDMSLAVARLLVGPRPGLAAESALGALLREARQVSVKGLDMAEHGGKLASEQAETEARALQATRKRTRRR